MKLRFMLPVMLVTFVAGSLAVTAAALRPREAQAARSAQMIAQELGNTQTIQSLRRTNAVTLDGEVVQIFGDEFVLRDGTGEILIEAEFYAIREANLTVGDRIKVTGEYDDDEFEARSMTLANGAVINVFDD